jgi:hypothetical protein
MGVFGWDGTANNVPVPAVAGGGVTTWTEESGGRVLFDSDRGRLFVFRALQGSWGASAAATITFGNEIEGCGWWVCEWENVDVSGTNGSGALRQVAVGSTAGATSVAASLAAFNSSESMAAAFAVAMGAGRSTTVGSGFTSTMNFGSQTAPDCALRGEHKLNDTGPSITISTSSPAAITSFEIAAGTAVAPTLRTVRSNLRLA